MHFRYCYIKDDIIMIKISFYTIGIKLSSSLDALLKLSKTTPPQKLLPSDCTKMYN